MPSHLTSCTHSVPVGTASVRVASIGRMPPSCRPPGAGARAMLARMSRSPGGSRAGGGFPTRRTVLTTAATGALLGGCGARGWEVFTDAVLTIATGNVGGVFHRYGEALATVLRRRLDGVTVRTRRTNASVVNVREVSDRVSDIGFSL